MNQLPLLSPPGAGDHDGAHRVVLGPLALGMVSATEWFSALMAFGRRS
ncbi:hypothetical protein ACWEPH_24465 [Nocardia beijingensis]